MLKRLAYESCLVVDRARGEATWRRCGEVETEHLLLGLLGDHRIVDLLVRIGVTRGDVRAAVGLQPAPGLLLLRRDVALSREVSDVLASAIEEADGFGHPHIGNVHVLLGLVKEPAGVAGRLLERAGTSLDGMRHEVLEFLAELDAEEVPAA